MIINNISPFVVESAASIQTALNKINTNDYQIVFVTDTKGKLIGSLTDGDFRRWLLNGNQFKEDISVYELCKKDVKFVYSTQVNALSKSDFSDGKTLIPIVDQQRHILRLVAQADNSISIGDHTISQTSAPFVIAEIGNNHQGDIHVAKELVIHARNAGAQCVKFQMRSMDALYGASSGTGKISEDLGTQYTLDLLERFQLTNEELFEVFDFSSAQGLLPLCTPWDTSSLTELEAYGMPAYKVASADFTNYELLHAISETGKPMLCSTGMSTESEIITTVEFLESKNANFILLHCNSTYPTPFKDVNLNYLKKLAKISGRVIGYSGHERGIHVPMAACALGAKVVEKHITLDQNQEGTDHKVSLLPNEFKQMCSNLTEIHAALGSDVYERKLTQGELINRQSLAKSIYVNRRILKDEVIQRTDLLIRGPGRGLQPNMLDKVIGIRANREIEENTELFASDLRASSNKKSHYNIKRPHGIPVRYHDYKKLTQDVKLDFVEFHFSYSDLTLEPGKYIDVDQKLQFSVHCPELFSNDHLLDLTTPNKKYRNQSVQHLSATIDATLSLKQYFPSTEKPTLIVNAGGWSKAGFMTASQISQCYEVLNESLSQLDLQSINLAIQTMPPFPWHFGGQSYHNLFVDPDEISAFIETNDSVSICLDTSHSLMACTYYGWDLEAFIRKVAPHVSYLHLADAQGIDGEGVPFGKGDLQLDRLSALLEELLPNTPFIPEVWQGHLNSGEGFWSALDHIESLKRL